MSCKKKIKKIKCREKQMKNIIEINNFANPRQRCQNLMCYKLTLNIKLEKDVIVVRVCNDCSISAITRVANQHNTNNYYKLI